MKNNILKFLSCSIVAASLAACNGGGGGGGGSPAPSPTPAPTPSPTPAPTPTPTSTAPTLSASVTPVPGSTLCGNTNMPCATVTVCSPNNPDLCDTIPNVLIDSGSYGLRVFSSLLVNSGSSLPIESINSNNITECVTYGDGSANYGPVALASITLNNTTTSSAIPIQLINTAYVGVSNCTGAINDSTPAQFGMNGIMGVGPYINDSVSGDYFSCTISSCSHIGSLPTAQYVANPIAHMGSNSNGLTITFPSVGSNGGSGITGTTTFGVATASNNTPANTVNYYNIYEGSGIPIAMGTEFNNQLLQGFLDTGSNGLFFVDNSITQCSGWYCPNSTLNLSATNYFESSDTTGAVANFSIANANTLFNTGNSAFDNLGGTFISGYLDYGLPFFFNKTVYICFNTQTCNGIAGPYWAF